MKESKVCKEVFESEIVVVGSASVEGESKEGSNCVEPESNLSSIPSLEIQRYCKGLVVQVIKKVVGKEDEGK